MAHRGELKTVVDELFSFPRPDNKTRNGVDFRHLTCRYLENWGQSAMTESLNKKFPLPTPLNARCMHREAKKIHERSKKIVCFISFIFHPVYEDTVLEFPPEY